MASIKVWHMLGIMLLGLLQLSAAQDESTEDSLGAGDDSNEARNGGSNADQMRDLPDVFQPLQTRAHQTERQQIQPRFESEEDEEDYDPIRDNFFDRNEDGTYVYGYSLPHGVRRYERSFYSEKYKGLVVEGFYTQARHYGQQLTYELRCYRSDAYGYRPLQVQYLSRPPVVERDEEPDVNCFDN